MTSVGGARALLRTSAAVVAMVWLGYGAMAQDAGIEDPVETGGGDVFIDYEEITTDYDEGSLPDSLPAEEGVTVDEGYVDEEIILSDGIGDGEPLEFEVLEGEVTVADGSGEEEPVFVSTCGGCEMEFGVGGPEVQRDTATAGVVVDQSGDSDAAVARSSSNACDAGPVSTMWICTVQNGAWRD